MPVGLPAAGRPTGTQRMLFGLVPKATLARSHRIHAGASLVTLAAIAVKGDQRRSTGRLVLSFDEPPLELCLERLEIGGIIRRKDDQYLAALVQQGRLAGSNLV